MQNVDLDSIKRVDSFDISSLVENNSNAYFVIKRVIDLVLAIFFLVALLPIMLLIAIAILIDTRGPVIYSQGRVGSKRCVHEEGSHWKLREFTCYKFRTMHHNAESSVHMKFVKSFVAGNVEVSDGDSVKYKLRNDTRVTRVGRILRKTSLDELPQFWNVVKGDMSLVGPRPDVPYAVEHYKPWHYERFAALPGLTGLWQVKGRSTVSFDEMARLDIEYARNQSLATDIKIMLMTIPAVISAKGAV